VKDSPGLILKKSQPLMVHPNPNGGLLSYVTVVNIFLCTGAA